jgi:hypothetical protein
MIVRRERLVPKADGSRMSSPRRCLENMTADRIPGSTAVVRYVGAKPTTAGLLGLRIDADGHPDLVTIGVDGDIHRDRGANAKI